MIHTAVLVGIGASGLLAIHAGLGGPARRRLFYLFKPLTTALILILAAGVPAEPAGRVRVMILIGLGASLVGDVLLMLPRERFVGGLTAFLAAHLAYLTAFTSRVPFGAEPSAFAVIGVGIAVLLTALWRHVPTRLRLPVTAYAVVIGAMAGQATTQAIVLRSAPAIAGAIGGLIFVFSDAVLIFERSLRSGRLTRGAVLGSYYVAQTLIALSTGVGTG